MFRVVFFLAFIAAVAFGGAWLADHPGDIVLTWQGRRVETSLLVGVLLVLAATLAIMAAWTLLRIIFRIPSIVALASRARRRNKGLAALTRGMVAVGAGDSRTAHKQSAEAARLMGDSPLTLLLKAQSAQLNGDRAAASQHFTAMLDVPETRALGLRGLHVEARRRGDMDAAHHFAAEAQKIAALPWAGGAVLDHRAGRSDWTGALAAVEANARGKLIDKAAANRQRAVLKTAMALDVADKEPEAALRLAREAAKLAPDLIPAVALAAKLFNQRGEMRKAARLIESAYVALPHPELTEAYVNIRPGDSANDRLARARTLAKLAPDDPESRMIVARSALAARDFEVARAALLPLVDKDRATRPTARACLMMAELEEAANGSPGRVKEWLTRASRGARDPTWIADGVNSDVWQPVSPVTGALDAFVWATPREQLMRSAADIIANVDEPEAKIFEPPSLPAPINSADAPESVLKPAKILLQAVGSKPVIFPLPTAPDDPGTAIVGSRPS